MQLPMAVSGVHFSAQVHLQLPVAHLPEAPMQSLPAGQLVSVQEAALHSFGTHDFWHTPPIKAAKQIVVGGEQGMTTGSQTQVEGGGSSPPGGGELESDLQV